MLHALGALPRPHSLRFEVPRPLVIIGLATWTAVATATTRAAAVGSWTASCRFNILQVRLQLVVVPLHILNWLSTANCPCNLLPAIWCVLVIYCQQTLKQLVLIIFNLLYASDLHRDSPVQSRSGGSLFTITFSSHSCILIRSFRQILQNLSLGSSSL